ncbi:MAG: Gfo/Idh/MocA family oxidoreductase [Parcubacteria group bacterium]|nr:Gfo/Idh/MocA family oxidoreductase [Parcubacteria group bacterium]
MRVAIIGAGLIGYKRAAAITKIKSLKLFFVCDVDKERREKLALQYGAEAFDDWRKAVGDPRVGLVIVATPNQWLASIALEAVKQGKHTLIEKPGAVRAQDLRKILVIAKQKRVGVWVGYNHRFHPAILKAHNLFQKGLIGELFYVRGVYGHGGRKGYEKEWRAKAHKFGGGEMTDQGSHLIDLYQLFLGGPRLKFASLKRFFWNMPSEDNAFFVLENQKGQTGFFHTSWTQWKNKFFLEIFGKKGALVVNGLGGSYGPESLTLYLRPPQGGVPKEKHWKWNSPDESFLNEMKYFLHSLDKKKNLYRRFEDSIRTLEIIESAY